MVTKMGSHGLASSNNMHFQSLQVTNSVSSCREGSLWAGGTSERCWGWDEPRTGQAEITLSAQQPADAARFSLPQTFLMCLDGSIVESAVGGRPAPPGGHGPSWALLADEGRALMPVQLPVLTAERLNWGGCRSMSCVSQEKVHNGSGTIKPGRFMPLRLGVCVQQVFLGAGRGPVRFGFLHPTVCTFSLFVRGHNACTEDSPPLLLNPSTKRYLLRPVF